MRTFELLILKHHRQVTGKSPDRLALDGIVAFYPGCREHVVMGRRFHRVTIAPYALGEFSSEQRAYLQQTLASRLTPDALVLEL